MSEGSSNNPIDIRTAESRRWQAMFPICIKFGSTSNSAVSNPPSQSGSSQSPLLEDPNFIKSLIASHVTAPANKRPGYGCRYAVSRLVKAAKNELSDDDDDNWARELSKKLGDEERQNLIELETFAKTFRDKRRFYGHNQDVVRNGLRNDDDRKLCTRDRISKFEILNCSLQTMLTMRPILVQWLEDTEHGILHGGDATTEDAGEGTNQQQ